MWGRPERVVRSTTRQVEPEWDDDARGLAEGLARYEVEVCPGCNIHPVVVDELGALTWEDRLCKVCRSGAVHGRVRSADDSEWEKAHPNASPREARPGDGMHSSLRPMTPQELAEVAERRKRR